MIILDFEKIVAEIAPETTIQVADVDKMGDRPICNSPIVIAEDSILLSKMIDDSLERAGFTNVKKEVKHNNAKGNKLSITIKLI